MEYKKEIEWITIPKSDIKFKSLKSIIKNEIKNNSSLSANLKMSSKQKGPMKYNKKMKEAIRGTSK